MYESSRFWYEYISINLLKIQKFVRPSEEQEQIFKNRISSQTYVNTSEKKFLKLV